MLSVAVGVLLGVISERVRCLAAVEYHAKDTRAWTVHVTPAAPLYDVVNLDRDDPDYADAIRIETALGIPVLRHDEKKPGGIDEVLAFFEGKDPEGGTVSGDALYILGRGLYVQAAAVAGRIQAKITVLAKKIYAVVMAQ